MKKKYTINGGIDQRKSSVIIKQQLYNITCSNVAADKTTAVYDFPSVAEIVMK